MHQVFISYSHKDEKIREAVCKKLEAEGIKCWYAPRDIQPGEEWADTITKALQQCKVMVLIFTDNSNTSNQVLREVGLAVDFKKAIIPFKCDDSIPSGSMQYYLSTLHWLNAPDDPQSALPELTDLTKRALSTAENITPKALPEKKKAFPVKLFIGIIAALLLLNAAIYAFLYSRGYVKKPGTQKEIPYSEEMTDLIKQGVVAATGEDMQSIDLSKVLKWVVCNNKLYYFIPDFDSPDADDYLYALLEDNTIAINGYSGTGKTDIIIPEIIDGLPVTSIGDYCFENNTEIEKVTFADTVDYVGQNAFSGCSNLREIVFSDNMSEIRAAAFFESGLEQVILPPSIEVIDEDLFYGCPQLTSVFLPEKVTLIPFGAFQNTPKLESVTITAKKSFIDIDAFDSESGVTIIGIPGSYTEKYAEQKGLTFRAYEPGK